MFPNSVLSYHKNWDRWQTSDWGGTAESRPRFYPTSSQLTLLTCHSLFRELEYVSSSFKLACLRFEVATFAVFAGKFSRVGTTTGLTIFLPMLLLLRFRAFGIASCRISLVVLIDTLAFLFFLFTNEGAEDADFGIFVTLKIEAEFLSWA